MISEVDIRDWDPQISVENIVENDDGSATCQIHANAHGFQLLVQLGFNQMLREAMKLREKGSE